LSIVFAIPDHPWVDSALGAAVRISMTVGCCGENDGKLSVVTEEVDRGEIGAETTVVTRTGKVHANLTLGVNVDLAESLRANSDLSNRGVSLFGAGFIVTPDEAKRLGLGTTPGLERHIRHYRNGRDLTQTSRHVMVIDLFQLKADEVRQRFPEVYQWLYERVKPERDHNNRASRRDNWWLFGETNPKLRQQLAGLKRYIASVETAKHRLFQFLDESILPDNKLVNIALDDAYYLGLLSSHTHVCWALASGSWLGVGNDPVYVKSLCFEAFPFPDPTDTQKSRIRALGEQLDAHRKRQQESHPKLTMTGMYNVLEKLRADQRLDAKEQAIHEQGLVSVLRQIHGELDAAVADAYGWPVDLTDEQILERLVALNQQRAEEERRGLIRWLRPEFQNPEGRTQQAIAAGETETPTTAKKAETAKRPWPKSLSAQAAAVQTTLAELAAPADEVQIAKRFTAANKDRIAELLETLSSLGKARQLDDGRYVPM
jgi:hypothetical protein